MFGVAESNWLERVQPIHIPCPSYMFSKGATLAQLFVKHEHFFGNVLEKQAPFEKFPVKIRATLQSPNGNLWTGLDEGLTLEMTSSSSLHGGEATAQLEQFQQLLKTHVILILNFTRIHCDYFLIT